MTQLGFFFDSRICTGCKTCSVSCKETYKLPVGTLRRKVYNYDKGSWVKERDAYRPRNMGGYFLSVSCQHCTEPVCVSACPTSAMRKDADTGIVHVDHDVCVGCKMCSLACPYGAPSFNAETKMMDKCDCCLDYLEDEGLPVCVRACPMHALEFGAIDELRERHGLVADVAPLPEPRTGPSLVIAPHATAGASAERTGNVINLAEEV